MKQLVAALTVVTVLTIGAVAFAHGPGWFGGHMGTGHSTHMMAPGYGGHMMGWYGGYDNKFLEETADLRRDLHNKKFEYVEALRNPNTDTKTIATLEKDIRELQEKIYEKSPRTAYGRSGGYGCR